MTIFCPLISRLYHLMSFHRKATFCNRTLQATMKILLLSLLLLVQADAFTELPRNCKRPASLTRIFADGNDSSAKPTLVVGATGKVGRKIVEQLLEQNKPVRALVRNENKARELFGETTGVEIVVADLGKYQDYTSVLDKAVEGCESIISVSGTLRFSKFMDFLPWRLDNADVSRWADSSHPYYSNYKAQCLLVDLAQKYNVQRFVRLTGLTTGYSPFNLVTLIFSSLLSLTTRYHFLCENYLRFQSQVPYVIVRPGGLADEDRDPSTTNIQVDPSGSLPPPGRVPRSDVAALCVAACDSSLVSSSKSYTLAVRAVGEIKPNAQGSKEDGSPTARECLQQIVAQNPPPLEVPATKPFHIAVGLFVYSLMGISLSLLYWTLEKFAN